MTADRRSTILHAIRQSLGRGPLDAPARAALQERLEAPRPNLVPARGSVSPAERVALFVEMVERVQGTVRRVSDAAAVPPAVTDYLAEQNLPSELVMAPDAALDAYPWGDQPLLAIRRGTPEDRDVVGLTGAAMAFAETGTLMMTSGPDHPSSLNFLPETHIVVIRAAQIAGAYEEGWAALRRNGAMPRTVNLVTGPSRTGDIAQVIQLGAHGPRRLHIIIVEDTGDE